MSGKVFSRPLAAAGQIIANGAGGLTGSLTLSKGGSPIEEPLTGIYNVVSNCVGTMTLNLTSFNPADFNFTINSGGAGLAGVQTDFGTAVTLVATRL